MKFYIYIFLSGLFFSINTLASTDLCPKMEGSFTCRVEENGTVVTWLMIVKQTTNADFTNQEFDHFNNGPDEEPFHITQKASDQGEINQNPFNPNSHYISKCAGDRINNYFGNKPNPSGGDRIDETTGDWLAFRYMSDGSEKVEVYCSPNS